MTISMVTGAAGFIGSHLVDLLIKKGHKVIGIDNLSTGKEKNINITSHMWFGNIMGNEIDDLFDSYNPDYVFHLAAVAKIPECTQHPEKTFKTNVAGTLRLLELSRKYKVKAFVYSSSSSIYGSVPDGEKIAENFKPDPISMYGLQKYEAELLVSLYAKVYKLRTISLRYFNVYGSERQSADGAYPNVISAFMRDFKEKKKITIFGNGKQKRDFVHVYDVAQANLLAAQLVSLNSKAAGKVINIGCGKAVDINTIAKKLMAIQKKGKYQICYMPARAEDPFYSCSNNQKAKSLLRMKKWITLDEGIEILRKSYL